MTGPAPSKRRATSPATLALAAAAIIAAASTGVALFRSSGEEPGGPASHGTVKPDQPVAAVAQKIGELEARLARDPADPAGWRMLGWSYFETGDLARSAGAYRRATEIEPDNAENWSSLGEALQSASTTVSPVAAAAFDRALQLDPADPRARYFHAVQADLRGQHEAAIGEWIALLRDTPPGAPWEADLRRIIGQVAEKQRIDIAGRMPPIRSSSTATAAIPGPTPQQMAAASSIPPSEQDRMVQGMVDRLAARLRANPRDAEGWIRLMRARMVMGDTDAARSALQSGLAAFSGDARTAAQLQAAAKELGVPHGA